MEKPIIVIGAGIGGLSAAIRLAAAGQRVLVLEQNAAVGGKMSEIREAGFRWDTGPSVITMRHVFEELFAVARRRLEDYLELLPVEPLTRYFWPDGTQLDATRDLSRMTAQIAALGTEADVEGYLSFLAYAARLHRITGPLFIYGRQPGLHSLREVTPGDVLAMQPWLTMDAAIRRHVRSRHLRQLLGRFATYVGGSPYTAPATLNVVAHVELTLGVWYPRGGIYTIAQALARLAEELGVEIRTRCPVQQIAVRKGRVEGVRLADGSFEEASVVLSNVDAATTYLKLLPPEQVSPRVRRRLAQAQPSGSGFILLLGVTGQHPRLVHHNIFFSTDYPREFQEMFDRGIPAREPTIYVAITSKTDPSHAPEGCENWFILLNAPALNGHFDWEQNASAYRDLVLARLAEFGLDVRNRIVAERAFSPADLARHTGAWRGALYGMALNGPWAAFRRPPNRASDVAGLYFAGGTTHPGGGVPMVILSGKLAAQTILADLA